MKQKILNGLKWFLYSYIWLAIMMFVIDIVTKSLIVANLNVGDVITLIPGFLRITYQVNTNFAFSSSLNMSKEAVRIVFSIVAFLGMGVILYFYIRHYKKNNKLIRACLMLLFVGAIGNLIDRLFYTPEYLKYPYNGVVDWIDFCGIWNFVFNWADSCLVVGAFTLIIYFIVVEVKAAYKKQKAINNVTNEKILSKDELEKKEEIKKTNEKDQDSNK